MDRRDEDVRAEIERAIPVSVRKFADCGPGDWWFVHHPDGFLIECAVEGVARQLAREINAGRATLQETLDADR